MGDDQKYYSDGAVDDITVDTGVIDELPVLTLSTDDRELIANFKRWVIDSKSYWDDKNGYDLTSARNRNERYYLGQQIDKSKLYAYQVPFVEQQLYQLYYNSVIRRLFYSKHTLLKTLLYPRLSALQITLDL